MADTGQLNGTYTADISKVDQVAVANIASINGITWVSTSFSFYNNAIDYSCIFDSASTTYTARTQGSAASDATLGTLSVWVKRTGLGVREIILGEYEDANNYTYLYFGAADKLKVSCRENAGTASEFISTAVFQDCSGWYHIVMQWDTTSATAGDRIPSLWVNGVALSSWGGFSTSTNNIAQNDPFRFCENGRTSTVGRDDNGSTDYFDGYMSQVAVIDGTAYSASDFGETKSGIWIPKDITGLTYGTNGSLLAFATNTHFGDDTSGNTNDYTDANLGTDHQVTDTPENNFCILNYNDKHASLNMPSEGGLYYDHNVSAYYAISGSFPMKSGKWYWEVEDQTAGNPTAMNTGILSNDEESYYILSSSGEKTAAARKTWAGTAASGTCRGRYAGAFRTGDMESVSWGVGTYMQIAFDADNNKFWVGKDDTWLAYGGGTGDPAAGTYPTYGSGDGIDADKYNYVPYMEAYAGGASGWKINFGQRAFNGTKPTGFNTLCTDNLTAPVVDDPQDEYINVATYTGDGAASNAITGVGFQPDLVWIKNRDASDPPMIFANTASLGAGKYLNTRIQGVIASDADTLLSFDSDGFSVGADVKVNTNTEDYVAWCLQKQSGFFDMVEYEGTATNRTVSHNLGVVPEFIMLQNMDTGGYAWCLYHHHMGNKTDPETDSQYFDNDGYAWFDVNSYWNDTAPTSTEFSLGTWGYLNGNAQTHIALLFASVPGISKVGSTYQTATYHSYVYTGFRPRWVWLRSDYAGDPWIFFDTDRDPYNDGLALPIRPGALTAEVARAATHGIQIYNDGFKFINTSNAHMYSEMAYLAFADQPGNYTNAR
jgi:hypothetical protein